MPGWISLFILTLIAGLAMVVGALIATVEHIHNRWLESELRHGIIAFGGGILVLVPEGMQNLHATAIGICFGLGGLSFMLIDILLAKREENASQFAAMLLDFIPEVIALGSLYLINQHYSFLLGFLIVMQNIPEGFNAYRELRVNFHYRGPAIIGFFLLMSLIGPLAGLSGYFFLSESPQIISGVMLFASGGILYLIFQDIAPQAKLKRHWGPSLGAIAGFLFGMLGKLFILHMK